jgi:site-specific DNA recombinase
LRAAVYLRVSSEEQAQHGYSLAAQRRECLERARALGAQEVWEFRDEGISASVLERPGLQALRQAVRQGLIDLVVIYDPDRFARNLSHQLLVTEEIEQHGVRLEFVNFDWKHTPEGKLFYSLRGAISEYEREKIRIRTMSGRIQKARQGKLPFAVAPLGYHYDPNSGQLTINEQEANIVRRIFREYLDGTGANGIALRLTQEGIPTRRGARAWHRQVILQILRNPVYMGTYYANRRDMTGISLNRYRPKEERMRVKERDPREWIAVPVPAIVSPQEWRQAQEVAQRRAHQWGRRDTPYLLSGLMRCGRCGQSMTGRRARHWGRVVRGYTCRKSAPGARRGCGRQVRAAEVEEAVWHQVMAWVQDPPLLAAKLFSPARALSLERERRPLEEELRRLRQSQRSLLAVLEKGLAQLEEVEEALVRLRRREATLERWLEEGRLRKGQGEGARPGGDPVQAACQWLERAEKELPFEDRRRVVRQLVAQIVVGNGVLTLYPLLSQGAEPREAQDGPAATARQDGSLPPLEGYERSLPWP